MPKSDSFNRPQLSIVTVAAWMFLVTKHSIISVSGCTQLAMPEWSAPVWKFMCVEVRECLQDLQQIPPYRGLFHGPEGLEDRLERASFVLLLDQVH